MTAITFTILGAPYSKSNTQQIVHLGPRVSIGQSKEAKQYERDALRQIPSTARLRLEGPVCVSMQIWYPSERNDLDESLILDCLQDRWQRTKKDKAGNIIRERVLLQPGVYRNDRQVREKHIVWGGVDKANPRAIIRVQPLASQQDALDLRPHRLSDEEFFGVD